ncbi:type II secretion system F family protein [Candidatus Micrarchaeota archaeon]|nr:type II secretion system F family protein [Candidatus Micrarchaeota archaeon]
MAISKETLQRIKAAVELEREDDMEESGGALIETDLQKMIERLRPADQKSLQPDTAHKPMNFEKVAFPARGLIGALGQIYTKFSGIILKLSGAFAKLPMTHTLAASLTAAGMTIAPETYLAAAVTGAFVVGALIFALVGLIGLFISDPLLAIAAPALSGAAFVGILILALSIPSGKATARAAEVDRSLPFALRQLSTQVKAGVSFHRAIQSIATSNYGLLSEEFARVASDVNRGDTMENALMKMARRNRSKGLRRTVTQVLRSFKTGGNLSQIITDIADDVSFEVRMSIRDFTEKLNFINVIYIMVGVVAPVTLAILSAILQIPLFSGGFPPYLIYMAFVGILGVMVAILWITKRMEPAVW